MLLRRVIGDALRARRQDQHRTLREVSHAANVSLGYLSEIERGQKEASSELLAAICDALGSQLSEILRDASDSLAQVERTDSVRVDTVRAGAELVGAGFEADFVGADLAEAEAADFAGAEFAGAEFAGAEFAGAMADATGGGAADTSVAEGVAADTSAAELPVGSLAVDGLTHAISDGTVSVCVRRNGPLRTTLHAVRTRRPADNRTGELTRPVG